MLIQKVLKCVPFYSILAFNNKSNQKTVIIIGASNYHQMRIIYVMLDISKYKIYFKKYSELEDDLNVTCVSI